MDDLTASDLLSALRERRAAEDRAAADQLDLAARWADLHPPESIHMAAAFTVPGCDHEEPLAGDGCPLVAEFCIAELGAVLGISTTAAKKLIGHALELRHRLPRLWSQVQSGDVPAWRARAVAETTIHTSPALTVEAARWVDAQVAAVAGRIGPAQLDRLVAETIKRYDLAAADPAADPEDGYLSVDPRHATLHDEDVHFAGTMRFEAELDIADALDLDRALVQKAAEQKALGSTESLDVRRSKALGDLARTQTALDVFSQGSTGTRDVDGLPAAREVVLHAHFDTSDRQRADRVRSHRPARGAPAAGPARPDPVVVWRLPHVGHHQARHRPHHQPVDHGVRDPRPDPRPDHSPRPHLRVPVVHPTRPRLRHRPRHRARPRRRRPRNDHNPARRRPRTSPPSAGDTTASRPTPPGATA